MKSRNLALLILLMLPACAADEPVPLANSYSTEVVAQGRYLVKSVAACGFCHGQHAAPQSVLSGGRPQEDIYGEVLAANLTPAEGGLKDWGADNLMHAIRGNRSKDGRVLSREVHRGYEWMSDEDAIAISSYLQSLPPVDNEVDERSISFLDRNTTGFMETDREVTGYVPVIEKRFKVEHGAYLVDNVARCGFCHNTPGSFLGSEKYLSGGKTVRGEKVEQVAPGITSSETDGIGSWTEKDIVEYLRTGSTPSGSRSDPDLCPVEFYKSATDEDLAAIAAYLKTVPAD